MARRAESSPTGDLQKKVRRLEDDLWLARMAIVDLMPQTAHQLLTTYHGLNTQRELQHWAQRTAEQIVELCNMPKPAAVIDGYVAGSRRAVCPLCGGGTSGPYEKGFAIPEGLLRHLLGTYNAHRCSVFGAAYELAKGGIESPFRIDR